MSFPFFSSSIMSASPRRPQTWETNPGPIQRRFPPCPRAPCPASAKCRELGSPFQRRPFAASERSLAAIRPGEVFRAVVGAKHDNRAVVQAIVFQILHHAPHSVIQLGHARFLNAPAVFGRAHVLIFFRQMRHHVHARRIQPQKERLVVLPGFVDKFRALSKITSSTVSMLYLMFGMGCGGSGPSSSIFCLPIFPSGLHRGVVGIGGHAVQQITRANFIDQRRRIITMERIFHRVQMV